MCMSFDLEVLSDGGFHPLACHGHARGRHRLQSTSGSGAASGGRAVGQLLALRQRKVQAEGVPCRAGGAVDPAAQAHDQIADDPQAATELDSSHDRCVVANSAVHPRTRTHQADFDFTVPAIETSMTGRFRHQLIDSQCQAPAPLDSSGTVSADGPSRIFMRSSLDRLIANPSFRSCSPASTSVSPSGIVRMLWTWTCW